MSVLEILLNVARFLVQKSDMRLRGFDETRQCLDGLVEFLSKPPLFLVAPVFLQLAHPAMQVCHQTLQLSTEMAQVSGESSEFSWIDIGFGHGQVTSLAGTYRAGRFSQLDGIARHVQQACASFGAQLLKSQKDRYPTAVSRGLGQPKVPQKQALL